MRNFLTLVIFALCPQFLWAQGDLNSVSPTENGMCAVATSEGSILVYTLEGAFHNEIKVSGKAVNDVAYFAGRLICACDDGLMTAVDSEERVMELHLPGREDVSCLAQYKDRLLAGGDKGLLVSIDSDMEVLPITTRAKGRFVGISAGDNECYAMTDKGELMRSRDGLSWTLFEFNKYYKGYYPEIKFTSIRYGGSQIIAAGVKPDGSPAVYLSATGGVWSERILVYTASDGRQSMLDARPLSIAYDASMDRFVLGCTNGVAFTIPGCSHCHKLCQLSGEDILSLLFHEGKCIAAGRNGFLSFDEYID